LSLGNGKYEGFMESLQGMMVIVGPIILAIAIAWALLHNRTSRRDEARTEQATRERYDQQSREDDRRG
jgi:Na+/H+ antiporter NhaC